MLMDERRVGEAVRLGVRERRWTSARARSKELRGWIGMLGEREVVCDADAVWAEFVGVIGMERSMAGVVTSV